jgi:hypothetical protein
MCAASPCRTVTAACSDTTNGLALSPREAGVAGSALGLAVGSAASASTDGCCFVKLRPTAIGRMPAETASHLTRITAEQGTYAATDPQDDVGCPVDVARVDTTAPVEAPPADRGRVRESCSSRATRSSPNCPAVEAVCHVIRRSCQFRRCGDGGVAGGASSRTDLRSRVLQGVVLPRANDGWRGWTPPNGGGLSGILCRRCVLLVRGHRPGASTGDSLAHHEWVECVLLSFLACGSGVCVFGSSGRTPCTENRPV